MFKKANWAEFAALYMLCNLDDFEFDIFHIRKAEIFVVIKK